MLATIAAVALSLLAVRGAPTDDPSPAEERAEAAAFERARAGDFEGSSESLDELLARSPTSPRACLWRERIFLNTLDAGPRCRGRETRIHAPLDGVNGCATAWQRGQARALCG